MDTGRPSTKPRQPKLGPRAGTEPQGPVTGTEQPVGESGLGIAAGGTTADRILAALVAVIREGGLPAFSVQEVADRAGVSHRTVYRHFPTRETLLEGLMEAVGRRMEARGGVTVPDGLAGVALAVVTNFELFSRDADAVEAGVRFGVGAAIETGERQRRTAQFRDLVVESVSGVGPADAVMAGAMIRQVASSRMWLGLRESGLDDEAAARAAAWTIGVLVDALRGGRGPASEPLPTREVFASSES